MRILITAGGTREYIDPVRYISNASSGRMGYELAIAAQKAGHEVTLITTVVRESKFTNKTNVIQVETASEMFSAVKEHFKNCDCLIMAAAVADYTPVEISKSKIKKQKRDLIIKLKPTRDILKWAGKHKNAQRLANQEPRIIVGFALEDKNLLKNAEKKLKEKKLDMIIANSVDAINSTTSSVQIKTAKSNWTEIENKSKSVIAKKIIGVIDTIGK